MNWLICPDRSPARKSRGLLKGEKEISNENEADDMSPKKKKITLTKRCRTAHVYELLANPMERERGRERATSLLFSQSVFVLSILVFPRQFVDIQDYHGS